MNNNKLIIITLLCVIARCANFTWNPLKFTSLKLNIQSIGHQSADDGNLYMTWGDLEDGNNKLLTFKMTPEGVLENIAGTLEKRKDYGFENPVIQTSSSGKSIYVIYLGCKNGPMLHRAQAPRPCARVFFIESTDEGKTWSVPIPVSGASDYIMPSSSLSMVLERKSGKIFIFFAKKSGDFAGQIVVVYRDPNTKSFSQRFTLPSIPRLSAFSAGQTINADENKRYLHLIFTDHQAVFYTKSEDEGTSWSFYQTLSSDISPNLYNYLAINSKANSSAIHFLFRGKSSKNLMLGLSTNHGKNFMTPIVVGASTKPLRDAIAICGSEEFEESVIVVAHLDNHEENGFIRVMIRGQTHFVDLPYPFKKLQENPISNLMVDCGYRGSSQFYITFAILVGGNKRGIRFAQGILDIDKTY